MYSMDGACCITLGFFHTLLLSLVTNVCRDRGSFTALHTRFQTNMTADSLEKDEGISSDNAEHHLTLSAGLL